MKIRSTAVSLVALLVTGLAFAQTSTPPTTPTAPVPPASPAPPVPTEPVTAPKPNVAEGVLTKSARANNDKGKYEWICTYRIAGATRSVQLDESCPQTMPFALKR